MNDRVIPVSRLPEKQARQLKAALHIKDRYADGEPLRGKDYRLLRGMLYRHPRGQEKIGAGIEAIVVHEFVNGTRCYFVIRKDGTAEDFSIYKCAGRTFKTSARIRQLMAMFRYDQVLKSFAKAIRVAA